MKKVDAVERRGRSARAVGRAGARARRTARRHQCTCGLHVPGGCTDAVAQRARERHGGSRVSRRNARRGAGACTRVVAARGAHRVRGSLSASAFRRHAQAGRARTDVDPRSRAPADGRAVLGARRADAAVDGKRAARALERGPQVGALHHARSGGSDLAVRSRDRALRGPRNAADRRVRNRPAAAARCRRDQDDTALRRAARGDLARDARRSAEGLRARQTSMKIRVAIYQVLLVAALFASWYLLTEPILWSDEFAKKMAFFFGKPVEVLKVVWVWFSEGKIYPHLAITLWETVLAFAIGSLLGLAVGLWLAMPRVILAPIFAVWFGLGVLSKVALGVTLVFFIVFFNVYQGVKEVSPVVLANARMLGASRR